MKDYAATEVEKFNKAIESLFPEIINSIKNELAKKDGVLELQFFSMLGNENIKDELISICKYFNNKGYCACIVEEQNGALEIFNIVIDEE